MLRWATPACLFLLAVGVRLLSWHSVFQSGKQGREVYLNGNDAYYHMRRILHSVDHFPEVLTFDPLMNFPAGAQPIWSPAFDGGIAGLLRLIPGLQGLDQMMMAASMVPPFLGGCTAVLVFFLGAHFFSVRVGTLGGLFLALLPAHVFYSRLANIDHHVAVGFVSTILLGLAMHLFRRDPNDPSPTRPHPNAWKTSLGIGCVIAALILIWPGALLHIGIIQVALLARLFTAGDRTAAQGWAKQFALLHLVACGLVFPFSAGNEWTLWGPLSPVVLSSFQPLYFLIASVSFAAAATVWRLGGISDKPLGRFLSAGAVAIVFIGVLFLLLPELRQGVSDAFAWFSKDEDFQSIVNESQPLFSPNGSPARAMAFLSLFVFVVPIALPCLAWQERQRPERLLLLGWALAFFLMSLVQWRFINTFAIPQALLIALLMDRVWDRTEPLRRNRLATLAVVGGLASVVTVAFAPSLRSFSLHASNVARAMRGEPTKALGLIEEDRRVADVARALKSISPPIDQAAYSVLGPWRFGHLLKFFAERPVVQDNFGNDVAPDNFRRADAYFLAENEDAALDILRPMQTRYVLVMSYASGQTQTPPSGALFWPLYLLGGSHGRINTSAGSRILPALTHHRLVHQAAPFPADAKRPYARLFEIVEGAEVSGQAKPNAIVRARLSMKTHLGDPFEYRVQTRSDERGSYHLRLPYSTEDAGLHVSALNAYRLESEDRRARLEVPEARVIDGGTLQGPDLRPPRPDDHTE